MSSETVRIKLELDTTGIHSIENKINTAIQKLSQKKIQLQVDTTALQNIDSHVAKAMASLTKLQNSTAAISRAQAQLIRAQSAGVSPLLKLYNNIDPRVIELQQRQYQLETQRLAVAQKLLVAKELTAQTENKALTAMAQEAASLNYIKNTEYKITLENEKQATATQQEAIAEKQLQTAKERTLQTEMKISAQQGKHSGQSSTGDSNTYTSKTNRNLLYYGTEALKWSAVYSAVYTPVRAASEALDEIKAVDTAMVSFRKATGATNADVAQLNKTAYETAANMGQLASSFVAATASFGKAGYEHNAESLAKLSLLTQTVGETSEETATQFLLATDKAYKYGGSVEKLTRILDGANTIENKFATDIDKIAEGLGLVAPLAAQSEVAVDELVAGLGTISAVTQRSGSETARALRALYLNLRQVRGEIFDDETGAIIDDAQVAKTEAALNKYGIKIREFKNGIEDLREPMKIVEDIANMVQSGKLSEIGLQEITNTIGGKLRSSQLAALIQNFDMYQDMLKTYANSAGSAMREQEIAMDSWDKKANALQARWTGFIANMADVQVIKGSLDTLSGIVNVLDTDFGRLVVQMIAILTVSKLLANGFNFVNGLKMIKSLNLSAEIIKMTYSSLGFKATVDVVTKSLLQSAAAWAMTPWGMTTITITAITAVGMAIGAYNRSIEVAAQKQKELSQSIQTANSNLSSLSSLRSEFEQLSTKTSKSADEQKRWLEIQNQIGQILPETIAFTDEQGNAVLKAGLKYDDINEKLKEHIKLLKDQKAEAAKKSLDDGLLKAGLSTKVFSLNNSINDREESGTLSQDDLEKDKVQLKELVDQYKQNIAAVLETKDAFVALSSEQKQLVMSRLQEIDVTKMSMDELKGLSNTIIAQIPQIISNTDALNQNKKSKDDNAVSTFSLTDSLKAMHKIASDGTSELKMFNKTIHDVANGESLTAEEVLSLTEKHADLIPFIHQTADGYIIEQGALENVRQQMVDTKIAAINAEIAKAETTREQTLNRLKSYDSEIGALENLAQVQAAVSKTMQKLRDETGKDVKAKIDALEVIRPLTDAEKAKMYWQAGLSGGDPKDKRAYKDLVDLEYTMTTIDSAKKKSEFYKSVLQNPNYGVPGDSGSSGKGTPPEKSEPAEILYKDRYLQLLGKEQEAENEILRIRADKENYNKSDYSQTEAYVAVNEKETVALKAKQKALQNTNDERRRELDELGDMSNAELIIQEKLSNLNAHRADEDKTYYNQLKKDYDDYLTKVKRFIDLSKNEIPKASEEWLKLQKNINDINEESRGLRVSSYLAYAKSLFDTSDSDEKYKKYINDLNYAIQSLNVTTDEQSNIQKEINETQDKANENMYGYMSNYYNGQKNDLEKLQKVEEDTYDKAIARLEAKKNALQDSNDEEERQLDLARKNLDIEEQKQKIKDIEGELTNRVLIDGRWQQIADQTALKEAKDALTDMEADRDQLIKKQKQDEEIRNIESQIESLHDLKEDSANYYQSGINYYNNQLEQMKNLDKVQQQVNLGLEQAIEKIAVLGGAQAEQAVAKLKAEKAALTKTQQKNSVVVRYSDGTIQRSYIGDDNKTVDLDRTKHGTVTTIDGKVYTFDTGGFTGNSEGLAYLHSKEIVLNPNDTSKFLESMELMNKTFPTSIPRTESNILSTDSGEHYNIHGDIIVQQVNDLEQMVREMRKIIMRR